MSEDAERVLAYLRDPGRPKRATSRMRSESTAETSTAYYGELRVSQGQRPGDEMLQTTQRSRSGTPACPQA